jgi:hypothetical protein
MSLISRITKGVSDMVSGSVVQSKETSKTFVKPVAKSPPKAVVEDSAVPLTPSQLLEQHKHDEFHIGSSAISKMFLCLELEKFDISQREMSEMLGMSQAYISIIMKFRHLPDEILVMAHKGTKGHEREIPIDNIYSLGIITDDDGEIMPITYKKLIAMSDLLPKKNDKTFHNKCMKLNDIFIREDVLNAAVTMSDSDFEKFINVEAGNKSQEAPFNAKLIAKRMLSEKSRFEEDPTQAFAEMLSNNDPDAVSLLKKFIKAGKFSL